MLMLKMRGLRSSLTATSDLVELEVSICVSGFAVETLDD